MRITAIVLAAGKGTRFGKSEVNKTAVLYNGKPIIQAGIEKIEDLVDEIVIVVGHKKETVINAVSSKKAKFVTQTKRLGTGHAVKVALKYIESQGSCPDAVFVANGDHLFMIDQQAIKNLFSEHKNKGNEATILTARHSNPEKLTNGRIVRKNGQVVAIIEKSDFVNGENKINELNTGTYVFSYTPLKQSLFAAKIQLGKELYITKTLFELGKIGAYTVSFAKVGTGVNTKEELQGYKATGS